MNQCVKHHYCWPGLFAQQNVPTLVQKSPPISRLAQTVRIHGMDYDGASLCGRAVVDLTTYSRSMICNAAKMHIIRLLLMLVTNAFVRSPRFSLLTAVSVSLPRMRVPASLVWADWGQIPIPSTHPTSKGAPTRRLEWQQERVRIRLRHSLPR